MKEHLQVLLERGVIRSSQSDYASPIVLVRKKSVALRLCVDYHRLNAKARKDAYPLPRIDESVDALGRAQYFSAIDLASAYNQVEVHPDDHHKTVFTTPMGLYEYNRMPFRLCNAPGTFVGKVLRYSEQHKTVFLADFLEVEPCKFKLDAGKSYRESAKSIVYPVDIVYLHASGVYEL